TTASSSCTRRPGRRMVTSTFSGASGTGLVSSTVRRERNQLVSPASCSRIIRPTSAVGGPPWSERWSHGPTATSLGIQRSPSGEDRAPADSSAIPGPYPPDPLLRRRRYGGRMGQNRLASETSPYLRQHADNPVDWYPWGDEAFAAATERDVPILLSVGYSACHWCHVMAHESFEDAEVAAVMNRVFVNVKVDREERPDVDDIYMEATQAMTGSGGWPMTVVC